MEEIKLARLRELIQKLDDSDGHLRDLAEPELCDLESLLREWVSEREFGYPVFGEN